MLQTGLTGKKVCLAGQIFRLGMVTIQISIEFFLMHNRGDQPVTIDKPEFQS